MLRRLRLTDYRNFVEAELPFGPGFTVVYGHNGAGKTNLLEALWLTGTLRSFRTSDADSLIRTGQAAARVEVLADDADTGLQSTLEVRLERSAGSRGTTTRRLASIDGKSIRAARDFYGRIRAVLFTPEDLAVLRGAPQARRQFLDRMVFARDRLHIDDVARYEKLLRARNRVLKDAGELVRGAELDRLLDTYDASLAEVGARIGRRRQALVDDLRTSFLDAFADIHGATLTPSLTYVERTPPADETNTSDAGWDGQTPRQAPDEVRDPDVRRRDALQRALARGRARDLARRTTNEGPHLDELDVTLEGHAVADFASQGQTRALVLALKLAELRRLHERTGTPPLLLLDDVSSELDPGRNERLFQTLFTHVGQCLLTTTATSHVRLPTEAPIARVHVDGGRLITTP